eukprot:TRINITY_DN9462_c0_g1_i1.p1 TRINITY_DN9462_c0_g1~~TRINITY_DN9462_c0_g1_i1.p1  ORF type:complete len:367 (-),score=90.43 TRINITY_DN9462_c0_g1_i1:232-1332(-)
MQGLLQALQASKLKHVKPPQTEAVPQALLCPDANTYHRLMRESQLEECMPAIGDVTFRTSWSPLNSTMLAALLDARQNYLDHHSMEITATLRELANNIDTERIKLDCKHIFVRLSSRSPKDAVLELPTFRAEYEDALRTILQSEQTSGEHTRPVATSDADVNARLRALYHAGTAAMRVGTGEEAVRLFILSDRIQNDMRDALALAQQAEAAGDTRPQMQVAIREFSRFDVTWELRAFVHRGRMTALTQYNEVVYFPLLVQMRERLLPDVQQFMDTVLLPRLPTALQSCVCDLILFPDETFSRFDVKVVELNPFAEFAGSGLFAWEKPADLAVLLGNAPFEFRVVQSVPRVSARDMDPAWAKLVFDS